MLKPPSGKGDYNAMLRKWFLPLVFMLILISTFACRPDPAPVPRSEEATNGREVVIDDLDREVTLPRHVERVVSLSPAATETLFAIGAGDKVVGVTTLADYPSEVNDVPRVGGYMTESLSIERIIDLQPDLVISAGSLQVGIIEQLDDLGIATLAVEPNSLPDIMKSIRRIGKAVGCEANADKIATDLELKIDAMKQRLEGVDRPTVYYEVSNKPLMAAGPESFLGQLIEIAGGRNIFADTKEAYPYVNMEELVRRNPQIILVPNRPAVITNVMQRDGWQLIDAIKQRRVFSVDEDQVSRTGPRIVAGLDIIAKLIHPERFSDPPSSQDAP
jgi:iron complex transport system substrate-binding protein